MTTGFDKPAPHPRAGHNGHEPIDFASSNGEARMLDWIGGDYGPLLGRFRRWLDGKPTRDFSSSPPLHKLGRLGLMALALILLMAPLWWLFTR